jgi:hypothetical protein
LPFDGKNPYLKLYYDLLEDIQQNSKEAAQKIIKHFDKDIRKADEENKLAEKELDAICEQIETFISWKTTSNIDEALGLAWELRGLVEENKIIRICQNSAPATRLVYSHLSSCAETAVENGQSEILQIMSASLGWGAVWEYKDRKRPDLSGYVLKCGVRLFVLCVNVLGDCSLSVFVGTLVIVHGAYSLYCKNISASQTIEGQLKEARINPVVILHKSLDLRKNQGSWSDLFGSRAKEFFNQYWKQLQATMPIGND